MKQDVNAKERKAFKDWFDADAVRRLADQFASASDQFNRGKFSRLAKSGLEDLEFHGRVKHFSNALRETLPSHVPTALEILTQSLPEELPDCEAVTDGWLQWPLGQWIADHGLDHFDESMNAMVELTKRFSSEFAVRPFVEKYPDRIFSRFLELAEHPNPHVRRWCSEGIRTRLPWGKKLHSLIEDPSPILPVLEKLKDDGEIYVRRSVANNLNDIARDHPEMVVEICRQWIKGAGEERSRLIQHALRSLVKDGHPGGLLVLGFSPPRHVSATIDVGPAAVSIGNSVTLKAGIQNDSKKRIAMIVDYAVHYVRKGGRTSDKVFKWKTLELASGEEITLEKKHSLKATTIRALYPGCHRVELQINGVRLADAEFELR
jgi:3-methyladenine DNA glycosylase AlkC